MEDVLQNCPRLPRTPRRHTLDLPRDVPLFPGHRFRLVGDDDHRANTAWFPRPRCQCPALYGADLRLLLPDHRYISAVSYTHLRAHETRHDLVCRLLLEKKKKIK